MGSPIAAMLAQAAPGAAAPVEDDAARDARIKALLAQVAANQQADPSLAAPAISPGAQANVDAVTQGALARNELPNRGLPPVAGQEPQGNAISRFLMSLLPSTQSLAAGAPAPLSDEERRKKLQQLAPQ